MTTAQFHRGGGGRGTVALAEAKCVFVCIYDLLLAWGRIQF